MNLNEKFIVFRSNSFSGSNFIYHVLMDNPSAKIIGISRSSEYSECFLPYKSLNTNRFRFFQYDINSNLNDIMRLVKKFKPTYIVNFAAQGMVAQSWISPEQWFQTNCIAIMNLANKLTGENYLKRYVQISSPEVYGSCENISEDHAFFRPSTPYAASKASGDISLYPFYITKNFPLVFTRATNVYGPYQQLYRIIPRVILFIKTGKKVSLQGGGKSVKSYIHIKDVCRATLLITREGCNGETYHISPDGQGISIRPLVEFDMQNSGREL